MRFRTISFDWFLCTRCELNNLFFAGQHNVENLIFNFLYAIIENMRLTDLEIVAGFRGKRGVKIVENVINVGCEIMVFFWWDFPHVLQKLFLEKLSFKWDYKSNCNKTVIIFLWSPRSEKSFFSHQFQQFYYATTFSTFIFPQFSIYF